MNSSPLPAALRSQPAFARLVIDTVERMVMHDARGLDPAAGTPKMRELCQSAQIPGRPRAPCPKRRKHVLIDHRTYTIRPGTMQAHLDIYEQHGFAAQVRHIGKPLAYMFAESGDL